MTSPSSTRKQVVTRDDLDTLNRNSAYARTQGQAAETAATAAQAGATRAEAQATAAQDAAANLTNRINQAATSAAEAATLTGRQQVDQLVVTGTAAVSAAQAAATQATLAATLNLRTAEQSRAINGLYGQRSGRGLPTFERGSAMFVSNDGTGPFSVIESPKMVRFGWPAGVQDSTAYTSFRAKGTPAFDPTRRLSASVWLRLADLANVTAVELLLFGYASVGNPTTPVVGPGVSPAQLATPGYTYTGTSNGVEATCTVGAVRGGWAQLTLTTTSGLEAATTFVEFLVRVRTSGAGKVDLLAPGLLNTVDPIAPQALPRDVLDLSPEEAARLPVLTSNDFWALGDSIVRGETYSSPTNTWTRLFADRRGMVLHNLGINGSNMCSPGAPGGQPIVDRVAAIPDGAGGLVIQGGGTNDFDHADLCPLGVPGSTDKSNFYGATLLTARSILRRTTCFLVMVTPLWRGDANRTEGTRVMGYTLEMYRQAVRDVYAQVAQEYPGRVMLYDLGRATMDFFSGGGMGPDQLHPGDPGNEWMYRGFDANIPQFKGPRYPVNGEATVFGQLAAGSALAGQAGWTAWSNAVATISPDRKGLSITAKFDDAPGGNPTTHPAVLHDLPAGVRRVSMQVNPLAQSGTGIILRAAHDRAGNRALCAWLNNGGQLDCGVITGSVVDSWTGGAGPILLGPSTVEVLREGGRVEVRHWPATQPRPDVPTYTHNDVALVGDAYGLSTIGTAAQMVLSVTAAG